MCKKSRSLNCNILIFQLARTSGDSYEYVSCVVFGLHCMFVVNQGHTEYIIGLDRENVSKSIVLSRSLGGLLQCTDLEPSSNLRNFCKVVFFFGC